MSRRTRFYSKLAVCAGAVVGVLAWSGDLHGDQRDPPARPRGAEITPAEEPASGERDSTSSAAEAGERDLFSMDLEELGKIKVTRPSLSTDAPSSSLDQQDVRDAGAATTGELLEQTSTVNTRRTSAIHLDPIVRGYTSLQLNASADGIPQPRLPIDIDSLFSQIDPGIVENITVVDGPYTSLYGPGLAFLVADLFPAARSQRDLETHGSTYFDYGTNGEQVYTRQNLSAAGRDWGGYFSYGIRTANDYDSGSTTEGSVPASYKKWDTFVALSKDLDRDSRLDFNHLRTEINDLELPGVATDIAQSHSDQFNLRYAIHEGKDRRDVFVVQSWVHADKYHGDASRSSKQRTVFTDFFTEPSQTVGDDIVNVVGNGRLNTVGARTYGVWGESDGTNLTLGADWQHLSIRYQELDLNRDGSLAWGGNFFGVPESEQDDYGLLAQLSTPLDERRTAALGGRLDFVESRLHEDDPIVTQIDDADDLYYVPGFQERAHTLGSAYLTVKDQWTEHWTATTGVAFAMRAPSLGELYSDEPYTPLLRFGNTFTDGSSDLDPEKDVQVDLGIQCADDGWRLGVRGFAAHIYDYVLPVPSFINPAPSPADATFVLGRDFWAFPAAFREDLAQGVPNADTSQAGYRYANLDRALLWGGDLLAEAPLRRGWAIAGTLSYVEGRNYDRKVFVSDSYIPTGGTFVRLAGDEPLPGIYPLSGTVRLRWFDPEGDAWSLELVARLVAEQDRVAASLSELPTDGFAVFGLRGHWRATDSLRLMAGVDNLFDEAYTQHGSLVIINAAGRPSFVQEPGISFVMGMELTY